MCKVLRRNTFIFLSLLLMLVAGRCLAGTEPYESTLLGPFTTGAHCDQQDGQFTNPAWATFTNKTVQNTVTLKVMDNVLISSPFTYTVNLQIQYYTGPSNPTPVTVNTSLTVNYAAGQGVKYKGMDTYSFTGGYKVVVTVLSTSINGGSAPPANAVQLLNNITIDRTYPFVPAAGLVAAYTIANNNTQLNISWPALLGAEEYDVEWTTINTGNTNFSVLRTNINTNSSPDNATVSTALAQTFRNNASRLTAKVTGCTLSMLSTDSLFLVRIRQAQYNSSGIRVTGNWDYTKSTKYAIWLLNWTEKNQNWQYSATFAEEGKKKEVISYFDGTLRGRQTVTLNTSDNVAIAQENIYDEFGRPSASILPAAYKEASLTPYLHYIPLLNKNATGTPYNYANIIGAGMVACEFNPDPLNTASGASKYYSTNNDFKALNIGNNYIPDAAGFPLSVTQYTADNTGRIKLQGGVGLAFQPGKSTPSNTTKYYYGKPEQWELDQLFANDAGFAEHYLKNMVVDPNGQISISYLNASGKTVATALTGPVPGMLDQLPSYQPAQVQPQTLHILKPEQFVYDNSAQTLTANTTYLASVPGTDTLKFNIQKLVNNYPGADKFAICSNCYYKMTVKVSDDCGNTVASITTPVGVGSAIANCTDTALYQNAIPVPVNNVGEYNVNIQFAFDKDVIRTYTDTFIAQGIANNYIEKQFDYIKARYLDGIEVSGCYADCHTCSALLGVQADFVQMLKDKCLALGLDPAGVAGTSFNTWATGLYTTLKAQCTALQATCKYSPCSAMESAMEDDVSPGGQYALFDAAGNALEPSINVLTETSGSAGPNWRIVFPILSPSDPVYQANLIVKPDNTTTSPNDAGFTVLDLITYWQPAWAIKFLLYHPEYCKLKFCQDNELYESWDQVVQQDFNKTASQPFTLPNGAGTLSYSHTNPLNFLLDADPFFKNGNAGQGYYTEMSNRIATYSDVLQTTASPVKSLMQFVDYTLYCQVTGATTNPPQTNPNWTCTPNDNCRVADREWALYRQYYFELKQKYYDALSAVRCGTGFCPVGQPISSGLPGSCSTNTTEYAVQAVTGIPACTGSQTAAVVHLPGTITSKVTVFLYYPAAYSTRTDVVRSVIINPQAAQQTFCVPTDISIAVIKVSSVYCGDAPFGNDPTFKVKVTNAEAGTVDHYCGIDPTTFHVFTTTIQLLNSSGVPVFATSPVTVKLNFDVVTVCGTSSQPFSRDLVIPVGQNTTSDVYVQSRGPGGCDWSCSQNLNCILSINGVSNLQSTIGTCAGYIVTNPQPPSSSCPSVYATKIPRFPVYSNFIPGATATSGTDLAANTLLQIKAQATDICTANAEVWIGKLQPGFDAASTPAGSISSLKTELIKICTAGGDQTHPTGSSTTPPGGSYTYTSFGAAIKSIILGGGSFTPTINPWLIDAPYPYTPNQQSVEKVVSSSNQAICDLLTNLETQASAAGQTTYNYLVSTFGSAMTLSAADLTVLHNACNNCKFILANNITLPVFLDPGTQGCITRAAYTTAKAAVPGQFTSLSPADANYQTIISNYLNQLWGFSLTYDDYANFEAGTAPSLCNTIPYTSKNADPYDCVKNAVAIAVISGMADYDAYIAQQRQNFMTSYITTCKLAKANANLLAVQQEYHYTLYYYDQADNLVRTVPPEGVTLLDPGTFNFIDKARELDTAAYTYTYNGPTTASSLPAALTTLSATLSAANGAVEMWLYNGGTNHYHWVEATTDKKYIFQVGIAGSQMNIDVYPLTQANAGNTVATTITGHYYANISSLLPLLPFTHVVFQGSTLGTGTNLPQLYLNGHPLTVTKNSAVPPPFGFTAAAGTGTITYPDSIQSLKHLRLYNHLLTPATIAAQAGDIFFNATDLGYAGWYRFNIPAVGAPPTTVNSTTNDEVAIYDTYPAHTLPTSYVYNSTNQVNTQRSPDGGTNKFWYDLLSRLVISQNDKQSPANNYSYTNYDLLGRITDVGQKNQTTVSLGSADYLIDATILNFKGAGTNSQITHTYYDIPVTPSVSGGIATLPVTQSFLRKRVVASTYAETQGGPALRATYYNYDLDGNIKTLWQQIDGLYQIGTNTGLKQIDYEFDLVSGKVNNVRYQDGKADAFYYNYKYDAENRLTEAWSSTSALVDDLTGTYLPRPFRRRDAKYEYYLHGPLRRMVLGDEDAVPGVDYSVQGVDYAYTLQGWLKGVNSSYATAAADIGQDGADLSHKVARDAYGYSLGYYTGDYNPIGGSGYTAFNLKYAQTAGDITGQSLYNGNISNTTLAIAQLDGTTVNGYTYHYDQLNRLKKMRRHPGITGTSWNSGSITADYQEDATYDGNGNILTYVRNGAAPTAQTIDNLSYNYNRDSKGRLTDNKLKNINDAVATSGYLLDLTNQTNTTNYRYDAIGNLIYDAQSGITGNDGVNAITWSVYGKIQNIYKTAGTISYTYNPAGQRVSKTAGGLTTWYVRDAQGNTLATYDNAHSTTNWKEQQLYGSSRLGLWSPSVDLTAGVPIQVWDTVGHKQFELSNHLGNVLETITEKRLQHATSGALDYYMADVATAQEYYPFGMLMPGRQSATANYRYGFNGKENDNEVKGLGNEIDYGERIYDPRKGRFDSVDPIEQSYPMLTPYQFASDNPIAGVDLDGREFIGGGWLVDAVSEGASKLGLTRTAGFINSYGHSLIIDPLYNTVNTGKKVLNGQYISAAQDFDPTPVSGVINLYQIGKKAVNGDKFAQGQFLGSLPAIYGWFKGIKGAVGRDRIPSVEVPDPPIVEPKRGANIITTGIKHGVDLHWSEILSKAKNLSSTGKFTDIYLNKTINNALGVEIPEVGNWRPDILSVGKNKLINLVEAVSPSQTEAQMLSKLSTMREALQKAGYQVETEIINPQYKSK